MSKYIDALGSLPFDMLHIAQSFATDNKSPKIEPAHLLRALLHKDAGLVNYIEDTLDEDYYYMELNDSAYADINANAIYRLACYYVMPNNIYQPNYEKGKLFLMRSRDWAVMAGDTTLLRRIDNGLATFTDVEE